MNTKAFFSGKVVLVTGASGGIGKATALRLSGYGTRLILTGRNTERLGQIRDGISASGSEAIMIKLDVTSPEQVIKAVKLIPESWGGIDILICCAGEYVRDTGVSADMELYRKSMEVNFFGTLNVIAGVLPEMRKKKKGHIIIVNSLDSKKGIVGDAPYVAAKCALDGLGDVLRQELGFIGINLTSVYPGRVDTPMISHLKVPRISAKIKPERVAVAIIRGIRQNRAVVMVPSAYFLLGALNNIFPRFIDKAYRILKIEGETV